MKNKKQGRVVLLLLFFLLFCGCEEVGVEGIKIIADIEAFEKYDDKGYEATKEIKYYNYQPILAEILNHKNEITPKAIKCNLTDYEGQDNKRCLPVFACNCQANIKLIQAHIVFDDERISLPYESIGFYKYFPKIDKTLGNKLFASKKYFVEIEFIVKLGSTQRVKGRWYFEE